MTLIENPLVYCRLQLQLLILTIVVDNSGLQVVACQHRCALSAGVTMGLICHVHVFVVEFVTQMTVCQFQIVSLLRQIRQHA